MALSKAKPPVSSQMKKDTKRRLWSDESMVAAVRSVEDGKGLRETARL